MNVLTGLGKLANRMPDGVQVRDTADYSPRAIDKAIGAGRRLADQGFLHNLNESIINHHGIRLYAARVGYGGSYRDKRFVIPEGAAGSAFTPEVAKARAIGEAIERYCAAIYFDEKMIFDSYQNLESDAIHPERYALFSARQYAQPDFPYVRFIENSRVNWTRGHSFTKDNPELVPAAFTYLPYFPVGGEALIGALPSTGMACGNSMAEAVLYGLYEILERDAIMITWLNQLPVPRMDIAGLEHLHIEGIPVRTLMSLDLKLTLHDFTMEHGIPTVFALSVDESGDYPIVSSGAACHLDSTMAIEKAVSESLLGLWGVKQVIAERGRKTYKPDFQDVNTFEDHVMLYTDSALLPELDFLRNAHHTNVIDSHQYVGSGNVEQDLAICIDMIQSCGYEVIVVDLTLPEFADEGLHVVRVFIPGMIPLNADHRTVCKGGRRTYSVPKKLGFREIETREKELNDFPHPFP